MRINMEQPIFTREDLKKLIIPLIIEQMLALSIGLFDTLMVSSCGEASVSGVSLVDSISVLLIQILSALATGGAGCKIGSDCRKQFSFSVYQTVSLFCDGKGYHLQGLFAENLF